MSGRPPLVAALYVLKLTAAFLVAAIDMLLSRNAATTSAHLWNSLRRGQMISIKCCIFLLISLLSKKGLTFLHRPKLESRFSFARLDSRTASQNTTLIPTVNGYAPSVTRSDSSNAGPAPVLYDQNAPSFGTAVTAGRSNYRNSGSELPLTVSSSIGSHSYRENRPSNEKSDRDRDRATSNSLRGNKDKPLSSGPYRGRGSSRSTSSGGGPDVIFSSGFDSSRVAQRGKETFYSSESGSNRDSRDSNSNQRAFSKPWKSRRPFDPTSRGIESTQDYPVSSYRTIVYDHLATSSLEGIEALPHIKFSKGRTYLSRWWLAAKKWNLLGDELKEIDAAFQLRNTNNDVSSKVTAANTWNDISDRCIDDETGRISTVLSQAVKYFKDESLIRNISISEASKKDAMLQYDAISKVTSGRSDIALQESERDYGTSPSVDDPLGSVLPAEPSAALSDWEATNETRQVDSGIGYGEEDTLEKQWEREGESERERESITETNELSSDGNNDDSVNSSNQKIKEATDSWNTIKDDDDGSRSSSSAFEGQWSSDSSRANSESDLSTPIDALYQLCDRHKARVICIGDVHGCVEELKDLLREVNYRPGDLVLLLGDLVAKGPSSTEVVRLAMDIGALSVRGNHDHEVVRQGLKFRHRSADSQDRDRDRERDRESREREKERDNGQEKDRGTSAKSRPSIGSLNGTGGGGGAVTTSASEAPGGRSMSSRVQQHLELGMQLSVRELAWLAELPFYIRSVDLGCVFVHAGFKAGVKLNEQDPWVMMTVRSLLPDGRMSPRCFNRHPWANKWKGPLTAYFGHDAARGLQVYDCAVGLDTGCVYGGHLSAVLLPEKKFVQVPARKAYQPYGKSRSHKMYAWSNDNDTETELTPAELTQYEYASSVKADATTNISELNHPPMMNLSHFQSVIDDAQTVALAAHKDSDGTSTIGRKGQESSEAHLSPHTVTESSVESYGSDLVRIMAAADVPGLGQPTSPPISSSSSSSSPAMEISSVVESPRSITNLIKVSETANPAQPASQQPQSVDAADVKEAGEQGRRADVPEKTSEALSPLSQSSAVDSTIFKATSTVPESRSHGTVLEASTAGEASLDRGGDLMEAQRRGVSDIDLSGVLEKTSPLQFPRSSTQIYPSTPARDATDLLLAEFLVAAPVGDERMTATVKKGLHDVLLLEFGSESMVLESLRILFSRGDYLRLDVGRALNALSYDLAKMESIKEGSCEAYVRAVTAAGKMVEAKLIELVRLHGLESDLPEFNMKRKPAKEEYIAIIFKLLAKKFDNDIEEVALYIESENKAPIKKGFGARSAGFGPVPTHPP